MRAATSAMLSAAFSCRRQPGRRLRQADFTAFQGTLSSRCVSWSRTCVQHALCLMHSLQEQALSTHAHVQ